MLELNKLYNIDCQEGFKQLDDNSIHLIVFSPPYAVGKSYEKDLTLNKWFKLMKSVGKESMRVLVSGGRISINVANISRKPYLPYNAYIDLIMIPLGFLMWGETIWFKGASAGVSTAWGCYDKETRVLTNNGLKYFRDIDLKQDSFATINLETKKFEYQKAFDYIDKLYIGNMYRIKSKTIDLVITPNHNIIIMRNNKTKDLIIKEMNIIQTSFTIPSKHSGYSYGKEESIFILPKVEYGLRTSGAIKDAAKNIRIDMDNWLKFLGIFLTDGGMYYEKNVYNISIYQKKEPFRTEIEQLLNKLPFKFRYKEQKYEYIISNKQLANYLYPYSKTYGKQKIPDFIFSLSTRQKNIFVDWVFKGDGSFKNRNKRYLSTPSISFRDGMINLLLQCGYNFSHYTQYPKEHFLNGNLVYSNYPIYRINLKKSKASYITRENISIINYSGRVYCVSVPNKTLFIERNGKFCWCGNSWCSPNNPTARDSHEYILTYCKEKYELGRSGRSTLSKTEFPEYTKGEWVINAESATRIGHPAPFPIELPHRLIKLHTYKGDTVLDPFMGSGSTAIASLKNERNFIGFEINEDYVNLSYKRIHPYLGQKKISAYLTEDVRNV